MREIVLYSTLGCHLCEQAQDVIWPIIEGTDYRLREIDISCSENLVEAYGVKIPVLAFINDHEIATSTLEWPFDGAAVTQFLS